MRQSSRGVFWVGICLVIFLSRSAVADLCDYYRRRAPLLYKSACKGGGSASTRPAGASSTFNTSFNLNAASLPSEPSSYGVEVISSQIRGGNGHMDQNFALVKGFSKFGAGLSTSSANTFYGDNILQRLLNEETLTSFDPLEPARGHFTNLNLGTAVKVLGARSGPTLQLGLSARYNKTTNTWGGGPALLLGMDEFSFGVGYTRETVSNLINPVRFITYQASVRLWIFEMEAMLLTNDVDGLRPIPVGTTTARIGRLMLTSAIRRMSVLDGTNTNQVHYAVQFLFSKYVSAGALFNYIPGANSVGVQIYL